MLTRPVPLTLPDTWSASHPHPTDTTPLGQINRLALDLPLTVPSTLLDDGTPEVGLELIDLRLRLLRGRTTADVRDAAWRHLTAQARRERGEWNLFALGMAYPGLLEQAHRLTRRLTWPHAVQVHFRVAVEFLFALHNPAIRLDRPYLLRRLLGAAYDHASGRKRRPAPVTVALDDLDDGQVAELDRHHPPGNPEQVLDRLVHQNRHAPYRRRLTDLHATLIADTYLHHDQLGAVAARLGISQSHASKQRARAAALIATLLGRPDLAATTHQQ